MTVAGAERGVMAKLWIGGVWLRAIQASAEASVYGCGKASVM